MFRASVARAHFTLGDEPVSVGVTPGSIALQIEFVSAPPDFLIQVQGLSWCNAARRHILGDFGRNLPVSGLYGSRFYRC